jgi:geranylgeranyl diphosphate synthase, type I
MSEWYYESFSGLLDEIETSMHAYAKRRTPVAPLFWDIVMYHFGWQAGSGSPGGKKVRPLLALLVSQAVSNEYRHALPAAIALEYVHNFTLIHDDVMDNSTERRHRQTVWSKWNVSQAINAGDGIYTMAMAAIIDVLKEGTPPEKAMAAMGALLDACLATVEGQVLDISFETREDVQPEEYITMIAHKSAALISCSAKLGALLSTDDTAVIDAYADFGWNLGIAFQIWDDYLGIWGEADQTGKSATSDIESKKKSYPVLVAFQDARTHAEILDLYNRPTLGATEVGQVLEVLDHIQAKEHTKALIQTYYGNALDALDRTGINNRAQQNIRNLAAFFIERAF